MSLRMAGWSLVVLVGLMGLAGCGETQDSVCESDAACDDANPCTADVCTEAGCQHSPIDATCSDGDSCTTADRCVEGACRGTPLDADGDRAVDARCGGLDCDDRDPQVHPGVFEGPVGLPTCSDGIDNDCDGLSDEADPGCSPCMLDSECDDSMICNGAEVCLDGICQPGSPVDCSDANPCTDDICHADGGCAHEPNSGGACEDGDPCSGPDVCLVGVCQSGPLIDADGDGVAPVDCGGTDCNDARATVHPQFAEGPDVASCQDGLDNDCDGLTDSQEPGCDPAADPYSGLNGLADQALYDALHDRIDGHTGLGYDLAREVMFSQVDNHGGRVECVYTGQWVTTSGIPPNDVMNTEHTWCQSWGADFNPAKGDLHHLFPTNSGANSVRGNLPFGRVVQSNWSLGGSLRGYDEHAQIVFEPRDAHKGDAARAIFYFAVRYQMPVDDRMEAALRQWNIQDPPDRKELDRCDAIEVYQRNRNPFADRPGFVDAIDDF
jgi:hypothetical protein